MFNRLLFENSRPDGFPVLEIVGGPGQPDHSIPFEAHVPRLFVPLRRTELGGEVVGPIASLRLTQTFLFTREQHPAVVEAVYRFPLPGDAAVTGVRVRFGEVEIWAALAERAEAERSYAAARDEGHQATLLTRESPDVFTLQIAGIAPNEPVVVETEYVQLARPEGAGWSLRVPLTTAPRYVRSDEAGTRGAGGQPLALLRDPGHRFALKLSVEGAASASSSTHPIQTGEDDGRLSVRLCDGEVVPDRDFVLSWQAAGEADRPALRVLAHEDQETDEAYFLAIVVPPASVGLANAASREVIVLVDHSGSMEGPKWEAADWAVKALLAGLTPRDTFNLGLFHDATRWLAASPVGGERGEVARAVELLEQHRDSGGTNLGLALEQALLQGRSPGDRARHVLIITDAQVSDIGRLTHLVEQEAARPDCRRVSVLCIDAAPNAHLVNALAERGGGVARFLTSDPAEGDITTALDEVLVEWSAPVLTGMRLGVNRGDVQAAGRSVLPTNDSSRSLVELGDLPSCRTAWVVGRAARTGPTPLAFELTSANGVAPVECRPEVGPRPAIARLFGARRVADLETLRESGLDVEAGLRRLGYDVQSLSANEGGPARIYHENARARFDQALRTLLAREGLRYGIACAETAFVATRSVAGRRVEESVAVANALPSGWSDRFTTPMHAPGSFHTGGVAGIVGAAAWPYASAMRGTVSGALTGDPMSASPGAGAGPCFKIVDRPPSPLDWARGLKRRFRDRQAPPAGTAKDMDDDARALHRPGPTILIDDVPQLADGRAVLYDSGRDGRALPSSGVLRRLIMHLPDAPPSSAVPTGLMLLLFVEDDAVPRARVRLADFQRDDGVRPLNIAYRPGDLIRIVLVDPAGEWAAGAPRLTVTLD